VTETEQNDILKQWLEQYKGLVFKIVRAYALTTHQDDLFQEIAIQIWRSIPAFRHDCSVSTWLYRISLNTAIKWSKTEKKISRQEALDDFENVLQETGQEIDDRLNWLYEEIRKLDEIDRSVALLLLDSYSYKEIAAILGITESNVGVKINRMKKHLISKSKNYDHYGI
jgi:RNA polymerase sigma-70 factor (ECF subfamily)